jgi:hypothetical protein
MFHQVGINNEVNEELALTPNPNASARDVFNPNPNA